MVTCLIGGMEKCVVKPVNYDKVREVTQRKDKNLTLFQDSLVEASRKYAHLLLYGLVSVAWGLGTPAIWY